MNLRKRKTCDFINPISSFLPLKRKSINWDEMISASSIRNYMLDDPLIDWLKFKFKVI